MRSIEKLVSASPVVYASVLPRRILYIYTAGLARVVNILTIFANEKGTKVEVSAILITFVSGIGRKGLNSGKKVQLHQLFGDVAFAQEYYSSENAPCLNIFQYQY